MLIQETSGGLTASVDSSITYGSLHGHRDSDKVTYSTLTNHQQSL